MSIKFTKKQTDYSIQLTRDCTIQNWDPKKEDKNSNKPIFSFRAYSNNTLKNIGTVQEKLLWALAGGHNCCTCDELDNLVTLTEQDLKEANDRFYGKNNQKKDINLFGDIEVKEFRYDEHYGIANITTAKGDVLRVDLLTEAEKQNGEDSSQGIFKNALKTIINTKVQAENTVKTVPNELTSKTTKNQPENTKNTVKTTSNSKKTSAPKTAINSNNSNKRDSIAFLQALGAQETRGKENPYACINYAGYVGKYQMGEQALIQMGVYKKKPDKIINGKPYYNNNWKGIFIKNDYGITSLWDYRTSPEKQEKLQIDFKKSDWATIKHFGLTKYIGKKINGQIITEAGLLAGAHLVGVGGLIEYFNGNYAKADGSGTPVSRYIKQFANFNVSKITG